VSGTGKPLRFLGAVIGGWIVLRLGAVAMPLLWEADEAVEIASADEATPEKPMLAPVPPGIAAAQIGSIETPVLSRSRPPRRPIEWARSPLQVPLASFPPVVAEGVPPTRVFIAASPTQMPSASALPGPQSEAAAQPLTSVLQVPRVSRWSLTGWMLWRRETGGSLAQAPLLGGSQAGVRLDYRLWSAGGRSLSLYGRVTRAFERPYAEEAALGISLRPVQGLPISLLAERRQRLGTGGRNGFAFMAAGGMGPKAIAPRLEVEGYAQGGIVGLPGSDGFADGRISLDYRLTRKATQPDLAIGIAVSGAAQTGASRLDIGPEVRLRLPVAGGHMRLSAEWRQRVAGQARPASGPTIALVADF
jgi:hypothetical protein